MQPQVTHFKSKKVFDFRTLDQYEDVIKQNFIFKTGDEVHLLTQFPAAIHHSMLKPIVEKTEEEKAQNEAFMKDVENTENADNVSQNSKTSSQNNAIAKIRQSDAY